MQTICYNKTTLKLKLNRVAVMHLNEFYYEKIRSPRSSIENIKNDIIFDNIETERNILGSFSGSFDASRIIPPEILPAVVDS